MTALQSTELKHISNAHEPNKQKMICRAATLYVFLNQCLFGSQFIVILALTHSCMLPLPDCAALPLLLCPAAVAVGIAAGAALRLLQQATLQQKVRDWLHTNCHWLHCCIGLIV
jgi:hypothetical protein